MGVLSEALHQRATIEEVAEKPAKVGLPASSDLLHFLQFIINIV